SGKALWIRGLKGFRELLVNLPHKGESHGLFEVRDLTMTSASMANGQMVYKANYRLQYFGPTPLTTPFKPLEILYALPEQRSAATGAYAYKSLFTQPVPINLARVGPRHQTGVLALEGPVEDRRTGMIRAGFGLGAFLLLVAFGGCVWEWQKRRQRHRAVETAPATIAATTLQALRHEGERFRPIDVPIAPAAVRLSQLIRNYVQEEYGALALMLTTTELQDLLRDQPCGPELFDLLVRCDALKYQAPSAAQAEEQQLWWEAMTLFEKLEQGIAP
ncbi:hypothetical protein, partial [Candidatus Entotheonella palauensis]|uniref:hypothetical protein n=1 Tax=Candidatus Entotheonella palauensis TaxID=93172 RepID=UPI001C4E2570